MLEPSQTCLNQRAESPLTLLSRPSSAPTEDGRERRFPLISQNSQRESREPIKSITALPETPINECENKIKNSCNNRTT